MAKISRTLCVLAPFVLSLVTLVLLILVFAGNTSTDSVVRDLYFVQAVDSRSSPLHMEDPTLKDWYTIGLMNYCQGNNGSSVATHCSKPQVFYWFNPQKVWHLSSTGLAIDGIGKKWNDALNAYHGATKWLFIAYIAAIASTAATLLLSVFAFCRQMGSLITSIVALASMVFTIAGAVTATIIYLALAGFIHTNLVPYGIDASIGRSMFAVVWFAAVTSVMAFFFWMCTCCCSDGSRKKSKGLAEMGIGQDAYQRVPSPMPGGAGAGAPNYDPYNDRTQWQWPGTSYGYTYGKTPQTEAEEVPLQPYHQYSRSH